MTAVKKIKDAKYICELPERLGIVTKLCKLPSGRMYVCTSSGVFFIIPEVSNDTRKKR